MSYSFTSTHPGLWRRTSISVFMSAVLNRINVLGSLQHKTAKKNMLRTVTFLGCHQRSEQKGGGKATFYLQIPQAEVPHLRAGYHSPPTLRLGKLRLSESLSY